jgi:hypothetical protein
MTPLAVPVPQVSWKTGTTPELEQPVELRLPALAYPDGATLAPEEALKLGAFVYRLAGGAEQIWNEEALEWQPPPADLAALSALSPVAFTYKKTSPQPWQGVLVAAGQKDKSDADRYERAAGGMPRYRLRAFARARRRGVDYAGLSGASVELAFTSSEDGRRFEIELEPEKIKECRRVRLVLKNDSLQEAAWVELRAAGSNEVELVNCTVSGAQLARVVLRANGDIRLEPAAGRRIVLGGELDAGLVFYQPQAGGAKRYL